MVVIKTRTIAITGGPPHCWCGGATIPSGLGFRNSARGFCPGGPGSEGLCCMLARERTTKQEHGKSTGIAVHLRASRGLAPFMSCNMCVIIKGAHTFQRLGKGLRLNKSCTNLCSVAVF